MSCVRKEMRRLPRIVLGPAAADETTMQVATTSAGEPKGDEASELTAHQQ